MNVIFFDTECDECLRNDKLFGICDDQNSTKAYTDIDNPSKWIAQVINDNEFDILFTPIDNCIRILKEGTNDQDSSCDGMLTFNDSLFLVELKNQRTGGWISDAKKQLENTIKLISENHDLSKFPHKKAFACNKKHPHFAVLKSAEKKRFFKKTNGFILDVQAKIKLK